MKLAERFELEKGLNPACSVIGPMVIAGVSVSRDNEERLKKLGLKDSKLLSPKQRERLAKEIEKIAKDIIVLNVSACKIDNLRKSGVNLNRIEAIKFADVLNLMNPELAYIDSPDVKPERLKLVLKKMLSNDSDLVVEHKADFKYPIVSAASIIAKVERDKEVKELHKKWGDFGPGYSSNEKTMAWLRSWIGKEKDWPDIVRRSWETARQLKQEKHQKGIAGFFKKFKKEGCKKAGAQAK